MVLSVRCAQLEARSYASRCQQMVVFFKYFMHTSFSLVRDCNNLPGHVHIEGRDTNIGENHLQDFTKGDALIHRTYILPYPSPQNKNRKEQYPLN